MCLLEDVVQIFQITFQTRLGTALINLRLNNNHKSFIVRGGIIRTEIRENDVTSYELFLTGIWGNVVD